MRLLESERYASLGLGDAAQAQLGMLGDILLSAGLNVTAIKEPAEIERLHFLDSLSLLSLSCLGVARKIVDVGSGAGFPALVLAIALDAEVVALESHRKKCDFIERAADQLSLNNIIVRCARAEEYGQGEGRQAHDVAISRALAALPVVAEYSLPLLSIDGAMVAMKGSISTEEWTQGQTALGILGADALEAVRLEPFSGAENRWAYVARKTRPTPTDFPRRAGVPAKRPLGS